MLRLALRDSDVLARLGANRFGVLLPEADVMPSRRCSERLRTALERHALRAGGSRSAPASVWPPVRARASSRWSCSTPRSALLTVAKKAGRRRVATDEVHHVH